MTDRRGDVEAQAERALRRGEFDKALFLYRQLQERYPGDRALAIRVRDIESGLQPSELAVAATLSPPPQPPITLAEEAEQLACAGDFAGALKAYRRLLEQQPDNELIRERLEELQTLANVAAPAPTNFRREALLGDILSRISARRR